MEASDEVWERPVPPPGSVRRLLSTFREARSRVLVIEAFLAVSVPALYLYGVTILVRNMGSSVVEDVEIPGLGGLPVVWLGIRAGNCLLEAAGMMLLFPVAEGRRDAGIQFLFKHLPTAHLAGALLILLVAFPHFGYALVGAHGDPTGILLPVVDYWWVAAGLAQPAVVWFAFGRTEAQEGRGPPGLRASAGPGLVIGFFSTVLPAYLVQRAFALEFLEQDLPAWVLPSAFLGAFLIERLLAVLGQLWFLRYLVLGRKEAAAAPAA